jgi:hypothetical protein
VSEQALATCAQELEERLNAETALYEQLRELARETAQAAERRDTDAVGQLMNRKNGLVDELRHVSEVTDRLRQDFAGYSDVPDEVRTRVSAARSRAETALQELLDIERGIEEPLRSMQDSTEAGLLEAARGRRVLNGYRQERETEPRFMDKRR